ncbi:MAG: porin family protein [Saprospiraceae bacterium]|jgi:hypothetical protein
MKHILFLICFAGFMLNQASAQENGRSSFHLVIKAGGNLANVYDAEGEDFNADAKFGYVFGAFMSIPLGATLGIQPEVLFSQKGFKGRGSLLGSAYVLSRTTNYIDVPIYLAIKPISVLTLLAGPQFSFLTKQKDVFTNSSSSFEQSEVFKNENLRKNILGISFGADLNVSSLVIGARANWDLYNNHGDGTTTTPRYKNVWVQATLGLRLI